MKVFAAAVARFGVSYQQIYSWVRKSYNEEGHKGLIGKAW